MPYRNLNIGDIGDDARRESLESGFRKIDLMFAEIFASGIVAGDPSLLVSNNLSDVADVVTSRENLKIVVLSQSAYDAIPSPDADTLYFIQE